MLKSLIIIIAIIYTKCQDRQATCRDADSDYDYCKSLGESIDCAWCNTTSKCCNHNICDNSTYCECPQDQIVVFYKGICQDKINLIIILLSVCGGAMAITIFMLIFVFCRNECCCCLKCCCDYCDSCDYIKCCKFRRYTTIN